MQNLIELITNHLSAEMTVLLTAALPIIELRGAIPVGMSLGLSATEATIISLIGSMIPVPFILLLIKPVFQHLRETRTFKKLISKLTDRSVSGNGSKIEKYGAWGLVLIVAIPLPGTGVWSGSLAASLLNMRFRWSFPAILAGNIIAALAVVLLSSGVFNLLGA